jgi:YHS domain-containing protein
MNLRPSLTTSACILTIACGAALTGCAGSRAGQCVGAAAQGANDRASMSVTSAKGERQLLNVDSSGVALAGHDPVAFFTDSKPVKGDAAYRSTYRGAVYQFASAEHKRIFDANPAKYEPQFGGYCAYAASIDRISPIDVRYWEIVDGRLLLQHNQKAWDLWHKEPAGNLVKADKNWPGLVVRNGTEARSLVNIDEAGVAIMGYDPVAYFTDRKPVMGDPQFARSFNGVTYWFASKEHKDLFEAEPTKYLPEFGGFCGYAASINKVSPISPEYWQVVDGKLVLQHTQKAFDLFNQDVPKNYSKAQKNWPGLSHRRCN